MDVDYCNETVSYRVARCYVSNSSLLVPRFSRRAEEYSYSRQLSTEYRVAWSVKEGGVGGGEISLLLEARTLGWIGFGLRQHSVASGNGMVGADIWIGSVM